MDLVKQGYTRRSDAVLLHQVTEVLRHDDISS